MRSPLLALSLSLSLAALFTARGAAGEPTPASVWNTDFVVAQDEAKKLNRPLVVHFHAGFCKPCRVMEREVLNTAQILKILDAGFVAVKVDVIKNQNIQTKFGIESLPTDMILSPEGKVLVKTQGYQDFSQGGDQDYRKYLGNLSRIDAQYAAQGKRLPRTNVAAADKPKSEKPPVVANNARAAKTTPAVTPTPSTTGDKLVPPPTEPKKIADAAKPSPPALPPKVESKQEAPVAATTSSAGAGKGLLAMEGYCPVTLRMTRAWKTGSSDITLEHEGQTFCFTAPEKRDEFKANPGKFAPRLRGCDPVALAKSDLAVRGSVNFGAFYEGELFLFESADNRATFRKDPVKFARLQHALKPQDVKKIASAVGQ